MITQAPQFTPVAKEIFERRYQWNGETAHGMFERVANHIALAEKKEYRSEWRDKFLELMADLRFLPNSPTLFNAGTGQGLLSACFALVVEDSLDSIMECHRLAGLIMKYGGGVGYGLSNIRAAGERIGTIQGRACGPVALLPYYNEIAKLITQGGKRSGAQMAVLHCDHPNIREFIQYKNKNPEKLHTFNLSVGITGKFMRAVRDGGVDAKKTFDLIAESAWKTGDPGVFFIDRANRDNPTPNLGSLEVTNPCGEVPMLHGEACTIGSFNLSKYIYPNTQFDWGRLEEDIVTAIRLLDDVIDVNDFPDGLIEDTVHRTRKIGLGVMGWADTLALMGIDYDSEEAVLQASSFMEDINKTAKKASYDLGVEKGTCPAFKERPSDFIYRNATRTCIAPTGSISQLAGCSSGIEPYYALEFTRIMEDKGEPVELQIREPILDRLAASDSGHVPKTAFEVDPRWHIAHQAAFQNNTDLAVSKTINMPESATVGQVWNAFEQMYLMGCKGGTIYRDKSRDVQVLSTEKKSMKANGRVRLPDTRRSITHKFRVGEQEGYLTVGLYNNGSPGELFVKIAKEGTTVAGLTDAMAIETSLLLQYQVPLISLCKKMAGMRFEPAGSTGNPEIPFALSIPDYIYRWLMLTFGGGEESKSEVAGLFCPDCNEQLIIQENCLTCRNPECGYIKCG